MKQMAELSKVVTLVGIKKFKIAILSWSKIATCPLLSNQHGQNMQLI